MDEGENEKRALAARWCPVSMRTWSRRGYIFQTRQEAGKELFYQLLPIVRAIEIYNIVQRVLHSPFSFLKTKEKIFHQLSKK